MANRLVDLANERGPGSIIEISDIVDGAVLGVDSRSPEALKAALSDPDLVEAVRQGWLVHHIGTIREPPHFWARPEPAESGPNSDLRKILSDAIAACASGATSAETCVRARNPDWHKVAEALGNCSDILRRIEAGTSPPSRS